MNKIFSLLFSASLKMNNRVAKMNGYHSLWQAMRLGNFDQGVVSTGTGISVIKSIRPAAEIVSDLMQDF